jgi:hypothetical protein
MAVLGPVPASISPINRHRLWNEILIHQNNPPIYTPATEAIIKASIRLLNISDIKL